MSTPVLPDYSAPFKPVPNVTPFTLRDGTTMLKKLDGLEKYIMRVLIPWINENFSDLADAFETQVNYLLTQVNEAIATEHAFVVESIGDLEGQSVEEALDALTLYINNAVESIINSTIEVTDPVIHAILTDTDTDSYADVVDIVNDNAIAKKTIWINVMDHGAIGDGVADDTDAIEAAMLEATPNGTIFVPHGMVLGITRTIKFASCIEGGSRLSSRIKAIGTWTDTMMLDFFDAGSNDKTISNIRFDANLRPGVKIFSSTYNGEGSAKTTVTNVSFMNTTPGVYAIEANSDVAGPGMLTGMLMLRPNFDNCAQWMRIGNNQDDTVIISPRGNVTATNRPTASVIRLDGQNTAIYGGFFSMGASDVASSTKVFIQAGSGAYTIANCFFEDVNEEANYSHLIHMANPSGQLTEFSNRLNYDAAGFIAIHRMQVTDSTSEQYSLNVGAWHIDAMPGGITAPKLVDLFVSSAISSGTVNIAKINFTAIDGLSGHIGIASGSTSNALYPVAFINGDYLGKTYSGNITSANPTLIIPADNAGLVGTKIASKEATVTGTTPFQSFLAVSAGIWLFTIVAKFNASNDHITAGTWIVYANDAGTNDLTGFDIVGSVKRTTSSFGTLTCAIDSVLADGTVNVSATHTGGSPTSVRFELIARRINALTLAT
jgi:hypothetical protein